MLKNVFVIVLLFAALIVSTFANTLPTAAELAVLATSEKPVSARNAIKTLRETGVEGLRTLLTTYAGEIESYKQTGKADGRWKRIARALDEVSMQKDVYASQLFWFTDLERAKTEAKRTGKPILSLRLLGNLNEELSCANSRFFRAILYPNTEISKYLRANYVLHWKSERPAPKITIDFGDGRKIERTITGNSIHYVLNSDGTVIDALPGLNGPRTFLEFLVTGESLTRNIAKVANDPIAVSATLNGYRVNKHDRIIVQAENVGKRLNLKFDTSKAPLRTVEEMPDAVSVMPRAVTKMVVEMPALKDISSDMTRYGDEQINLETWKSIAAATGKQSKLDMGAIAFIRRQTAANGLSDAEFAAMITKLEDYLSVDTARNEFLMRPTLLVWLAKDGDRDLEALNTKIYSQLFLTPRTDKWLGLYAPDIYTALDGNGIEK